jgi:alkanesulfonate monooxygenase SsuD/methylene tetrahydromethanopterin reductase-like flavin-dependent oxidoreductase (luciferase family)
MAAMTPKTLERAAKMGLVPYIGPAAPIGNVKEWLPNYRQMVGDDNAKVSIRRDVFLVRDRSKAWEMAEKFVEEKYKMYMTQGFDSSIGDTDLRQAMKERIIVGDIEECAASLAEYFEMGAGPIILRCQWPSLDPSETHRMVEDIAKAVDLIK